MSIPVAKVVIDVLVFTIFSVAKDITVAIVFIDAVVGAASVPLLVQLRELHAPCVVSCTVPSSSVSVVGQGRKSPSVYVVSPVKLEMNRWMLWVWWVRTQSWGSHNGEAGPHLLIDVLSRHLGCRYGTEAIENFCAVHNFTRIVRGHTMAAEVGGPRMRCLFAGPAHCY